MDPAVLIETQELADRNDTKFFFKFLIDLEETLISIFGCIFGSLSPTKVAHLRLKSSMENCVVQRATDSSDNSFYRGREMRPPSKIIASQAKDIALSLMGINRKRQSEGFKTSGYMTLALRRLFPMPSFRISVFLFSLPLTVVAVSFALAAPVRSLRTVLFNTPPFNAPPAEILSPILSCEDAILDWDDCRASLFAVPFLSLNCFSTIASLGSATVSLFRNTAASLLRVLRLLELPGNSDFVSFSRV